MATDWDIDYSWSLGLRTGAALSFGSSASAWKIGPEVGLIFELPWVNSVTFLAEVDHARHTLRSGRKYLQDAPELAGEALDGAASHTIPRVGVRWLPPRKTRPVEKRIEVHPYLSFHLGADAMRTSLELPTTEGRTRVTTVGVHPMMAGGAGLLVELGDGLDLALGISPAVLFTYDPAEVGGSDRLAVTGRLGAGLDVLGRF
jgi:hypothetical protein